MKVILLVAVQGLGERGEIVEVKNGYARNYLIPKMFAVPATPSNLKAFKAEARLKALKEEKEKEKAEELAKRLSKLTLTLSLKVGEGVEDKEKVFGSIGSHDILRALKAKGIELEKGSIHLEEPIKELGSFKVPVRLFKDIEATVRVQVVKEE